MTPHIPETSLQVVDHTAGVLPEPLRALALHSIQVHPHSFHKLHPGSQASWYSAANKDKLPQVQPLAFPHNHCFFHNLQISSAFPETSALLLYNSP